MSRKLKTNPKILPDEIREELEKHGKPWDVEKGSRHLHIRVEGKLVGILPMSGKNRCADRRVTLNIRSQIRHSLAGTGAGRKCRTV